MGAWRSSRSSACGRSRPPSSRSCATASRRERNAALGAIRALVVAPDFAPQAKVLAEARGVECIVLDVPRLLAEAGPDDLTLFS